MAKKEAFDHIKWERRQQRRLNARSKAIKELFDDLAQRASLLGIDVKLPSDKDFEFKNYPALEKRVDELVRLNRRAFLPAYIFTYSLIIIYNFILGSSYHRFQVL